MIEFPEARVLARQSREHLVGRGIVKVTAAASPHGFAFYFGDPAAYGPLLTGRTIDDAQAFGGQMELTAGEARMVFNDGVNLRLMKADAKRPVKHQLMVELDDGSGFYCTVQMYGGILAFVQGDHDDNSYYRVAKDKPSILSEAFTPAYFEGLRREVTEPNLSVKGFLATKQRIPGLGNGVLHDILFVARIHPKTKLKTLTDEALERLYHSVRERISLMDQMGGRDTEKDLLGQPGGYKTVLSSKTLHFPCPECGGPLSRQAYLGGNIYFCGHCQQLT